MKLLYTLYKFYMRYFFIKNKTSEMIFFFFKYQILDPVMHRNLIFSFHIVVIQVKINKIFQREIVNIFLPILFSISFGCSKEPSH